MAIPTFYVCDSNEDKDQPQPLSKHFVETVRELLRLMSYRKIATIKMLCALQYQPEYFTCRDGKVSHQLSLIDAKCVVEFVAKKYNLILDSL